MPDAYPAPPTSLYPQPPQPGAMFGGNALQMVGNILDIRRQQLLNSTLQLGLSLNQNQASAAMFAALAANPNANINDVYSTAAQLARMGIPGEIVAPWVSRMEAGGPNNFKANLAAVNGYAMGAANASARVPGPPGSGGEPTTMNTATAGAMGAYPTGLAPGAPEALAANRAAYVGDQQKSASTLANMRQIQAALPLIGQLGSSNFGAGSSQFANIKSALANLGIIDPNTSDLQVRQEAGKYLLKYAQGAQNAGRSDQALSTAIGSNPNLDLTAPANLALIKNQIGMDRMDAAIPLAFSKSPMGSDQSKYLDFKSNFYQNHDPRAFSFDTLSPDERMSVLASVGFKNGAPPKPGSSQYGAWVKFGRSLDLAKALGYFGGASGPQ